MTLHTPQHIDHPSLKEALSFPSDLIKKFIPLGIMLFFVAFSYMILRDMKDTVLIIDLLRKSYFKLSLA